MAGNDSTRSARRISSASALPPRYAASKPAKVPITPATNGTPAPNPAAGPKAIQNAGVQIPPLPVRAEPVSVSAKTIGAAGRQARVEHIQLHQVVRILRRQPRR